MVKFAAHYGLLPEGLVRWPLVEVDEQEGVILSVGRCDPDALDSIPGVKFFSGIIVPSFVNAHTHLELSYLHGAIAEGCGYAGFADAMARVRRNASPQERLRAAAEADRTMWDEGTAAAGDICNDASSFDVKAASRIRYRSFAEVFGLRTPSTAAARGLLQHPRTSLTPHSLYSLNDTELRRVVEESEGPLSIHFMESESERELFEGRGALHEWYAAMGFECDFLHYASPAERLVSLVPADRSLLLVHCRCVSQHDIDLIMNHFTAPVYWVLCPRSNRYISGAGPDVGLLRRNGLDICIGTDSLASNSSLSMVGELKCLDVPLGESLRWATTNGARALGFDGLGELRAGSRCGLTLIEGADMERLRMGPDARARRIFP